MGNACLQKILWVMLIFGLLAAASGCETVGAMKAGEIKMEDFVQMTMATLPGPTSTGRQNAGAQDCSGLDAWFKNNLW